MTNKVLNSDISEKKELDDFELKLDVEEKKEEKKEDKEEKSKSKKVKVKDEKKQEVKEDKEESNGKFELLRNLKIFGNYLKKGDVLEIEENDFLQDLVSKGYLKSIN